MRRFAQGLVTLFALVSLAATAGTPTVSGGAPSVSKVTPVAPGQKPAGCPAGQTLKVDRSCDPLRNRTCKPFACVAAPGGRVRAVAPPKVTNPNCPKATPGSKVTPKC